MSPGEQPFVQLEGETCEAGLGAFVRESGEKECTRGGLEEENVDYVRARALKVDGKSGERNGGRKKGRKEGRK